jgi:SAM-dependent methyltransferase
MVIASEAELMRQAARERPGQPGLWLQPGAFDLGDSDCLEAPGLRLHAAGDGYSGDVRCGQALPLASESCGVVVVQHLADISTAPAALLAECARVLVPGGRLWLLALNPLAPYRLRWHGKGPRAAEPVTWRRRLRAAGLVPEPVSQGIGPSWAVSIDTHLQDGAGLRAAFLLRAEKRRIPLTPTRATGKLRLQPGLPAA